MKHHITKRKIRFAIDKLNFIFRISSNYVGKFFFHEKHHSTILKGICYFKLKFYSLATSTEHIVKNAIKFQANVLIFQRALSELLQSENKEQ